MNISDSHYQYLQNPAYLPANVPNYSYPPALEIHMNYEAGNEEKTRKKSLQKFYNVRSKGLISFFIIFILSLFALAIWSIFLDEANDQHGKMVITKICKIGVWIVFFAWVGWLILFLAYCLMKYSGDRRSYFFVCRKLANLLLFASFLGLYLIIINFDIILYSYREIAYYRKFKVDDDEEDELMVFKWFLVGFIYEVCSKIAIVGLWAYVFYFEKIERN